MILIVGRSACAVKSPSQKCGVFKEVTLFTQERNPIGSHLGHLPERKLGPR